MTLNIYVPNRGAHKYIQQISVHIKGEIDNNTIIVGDFTTPHTSMDRSPRDIINKAKVVLNDNLDQLNLIDIYKTFHPKSVEYTFFSSAHGTFSTIDHRLGQKISLNKFKTEILSCIFF